MEYVLQKLATYVIAGALSVASIFGYGPAIQAPELGATIPVTPALFSTSLAASITSSATSMTLVSGTDKAGNALSGYICFVLDEGSANAEFTCGTASSTSVTSMIRGVDPIDGDLEVTALKQSHRRGASVKVTTYPITGILARILNGDETIPNELTYASGVTTSTIMSAGKNLVDVATLQSVALAGAANGSETLQGLIELATQSECAAGTSAGGTGARLTCPNTYFNATQSATTTVPVTNTSGKLSQSFLDLTASWAFSGALSSSATTTLANTVITGSVTLPTSSLPVVRVYTTSSTWTKPANLRYLKVEVIGGGGGGGGATTNAKAAGGGGGGGYSMEILESASLAATETYIVGNAGTAGAGSGGNGGTGGTSSFGSTPFLQATGGAGGIGDAGTGAGGLGGVGSSGTLNSQGGAGGGAFVLTQPSGAGGSTVYGGGGNPKAATGNGVAGGAYGGGGSGGYSDGGDRDGGAGANGVVIVTEYYL